MATENKKLLPSRFEPTICKWHFRQPNTYTGREKKEALHINFFHATNDFVTSVISYPKHLFLTQVKVSLLY